MALYSEGWHWISIFMILWNRKQHSNIVRLLLVYTPNLFDWHSNIWDLIDPLERHANSYKRKEATGRYKKALACIRIPLNDHTNPQHHDWYQIAKRITYVNATFICCPIWCLCDVMWNHQTSFEVGLYDATFMKLPLSYLCSMSIMVHVGHSYFSLFVNLK